MTPFSTQYPSSHGCAGTANEKTSTSRFSSTIETSTIPGIASRRLHLEEIEYGVGLPLARGRRIR